MATWSSEIKVLEDLFPSLGFRYPGLEKELGRLIRTDDENMILLYSRRCLEVIITDLCECELKRPRKTEPLQGIIDKLNKEGKVPSHIIASMHGLNSLSAFGAHPGDYDPEQLKPVLVNLDIIIRWYLGYKDSAINLIREGKEVTDRQGELTGKVSSGSQTRIKNKPGKPTRQKLISGALVFVFFILASILAGSYIFKWIRLQKLKSEDGKISIAVMPFINLTSDSLFDIWQPGLQNLLITSLSNSEGLSVRQFETMDKILGGAQNPNYASITPSFASNTALRLKANTVITGSILKSGDRIQIISNLMDSRTEEIYKSYNVACKKEDDFFIRIDSLSKLIMNFLEIRGFKQKFSQFELKNIYTSSAPAFKYYIQGRIFHGQLEYKSAAGHYINAIQADTGFIAPMLMLSYVYGDEGKAEESKKWVYRAYRKIDSMPLEIQLQIREVKAAVDKEPKELIKILRQYLELNSYSTRVYYAIGWASFNTEQWQDAIDALEKGIELQKSIGRGKLWIWHYVLLGNAYHKTGQHDKEMKAYEDGLSLWPDQEQMLTYRQAVCPLSRGDTIKANDYMKKIRAIGLSENWPEPEILNWLAGIHYEANLPGKAEELYRRALMLDRTNTEIKVSLAHLLIKNDINVDEGVELVKSSLEVSPDNSDLLFVYGSGLLKQGNPVKALEYLNRSWQLKPYYDHEHYLCIQEAKKVISGME